MVRPVTLRSRPRIPRANTKAASVGSTVAIRLYRRPSRESDHHNGPERPKDDVGATRLDDECDAHGYCDPAEVGQPLRVAVRTVAQIAQLLAGVGHRQRGLQQPMTDRANLGGLIKAQSR